MPTSNPDLEAQQPGDRADDDLGRRRLLVVGAWTLPALVTAVAAPRVAASTEEVPIKVIQSG